ncbi:hypothetical protein PBI_JACE_8 [Gordonia phage Jace]|uniref:Head-to-tail stopper n=1 Tax=Gordonia phage Jace TaxID=2182360 RepID=A0A2U8UJ39_9CAUD|nr:head-tail connector protein [Gordonia phage Jace]AWN03630.1 hypothetical protein PBI_JACE_8 [Gordonia phage Jace]
MARRDRLARWWRHKVTVQRHKGEGAYGPVFETAVPVMAAIDDKARMVRNADGVEVVSSTTVAMPATTPYIPVGSLLTLPPQYGEREARVIACTVADGGTDADHLQVNLE